MKIEPFAELVSLDDVEPGAVVRWKRERLFMVVTNSKLDDGKKCLAALDTGYIYTPWPDRLVEVVHAVLKVGT